MSFKCIFNSVYQNDAIVLTEEVGTAQKNSVVKRAPVSKKILLLTKPFGRGTDFQVHDKIVTNNGGPHAVQTFLSQQKSQEKQIMGRTARQGADGSYTMVLIDSELKNMRLRWMISKNKARMVYCMDAGNERFVKEAKTSHDKAERLFQVLKASNEIEVKKLLIDENRVAFVDGGTVKIPIAMDQWLMNTKIQKYSANNV